MDFFNLLPDHLLPSILSFLPLTDAARTSLLSRRWARQWADYWSHMTDFDLDLDLLFPRNCQKQAELVDTIISSPRRTIRKFEISGLSDYGWHRRIGPRYLVLWAQKLVEKGVNELSLLNTGVWYPAPNCLLSSKSLTALRLSFCSLDLGGTSIVSCTNLKYLELDFVTLSANLVTEIVSTCKKLEFLGLDYCDPHQLVLRSQSLIKLHLMESYCYIDVNAPNLEELDLQVMADFHRVYVPKVRKCTFRRQQRMRECNESLTQKLTDVVTAIGSCVYLQLGGALLQLLSLCTSSWQSKIRFPALKKLCITLCSSDWRQTSAFNAFLQSCPQLQELSFDLVIEYDSLKDSSVNGEPFHCPSQYLDQVELIGFRGNKYEMSILKFIQAKGVFKTEPEEECNGVTFLEKRNHRVLFKLGECRVRIEVPLAFNVQHLVDFLTFD